MITVVVILLFFMKKCELVKIHYFENLQNCQNEEEETEEEVVRTVLVENNNNQKCFPYIVVGSEIFFSFSVFYTHDNPETTQKFVSLAFYEDPLCKNTEVYKIQATSEEMNKLCIYDKPISGVERWIRIDVKDLNEKQHITSRGVFAVNEQTNLEDETFSCYGISSNDSNVCNGHGNCTAYNNCSCEEGFNLNAYCYEEINQNMSSSCDDCIDIITLDPPLFGNTKLSVSSNGVNAISTYEADFLDYCFTEDDFLSFYIPDNDDDDDYFIEEEYNENATFILIGSYYTDQSLQNGGKVNTRVTSKQDDLKFFRNEIGGCINTKDLNRLIIINSEEVAPYGFEESFGTSNHKTVVMWGENTDKAVVILNYYEIDSESENCLNKVFCGVVTNNKTFFDISRNGNYSEVNSRISNQSFYIELDKEGNGLLYNNTDNCSICKIVHRRDESDCLHGDCSDAYTGDLCDTCPLLNPREGSCIFGDCKDEWYGDYCDLCNISHPATSDECILGQCIDEWSGDYCNVCELVHRKDENECTSNCSDEWSGELCNLCETISNPKENTCKKNECKDYYYGELCQEKCDESLFTENCSACVNLIFKTPDCYECVNENHTDGNCTTCKNDGIFPDCIVCDDGYTFKVNSNGDEVCLMNSGSISGGAVTGIVFAVLGSTVGLIICFGLIVTLVILVAWISVRMINIAKDRAIDKEMDEIFKEGEETNKNVTPQIEKKEDSEVTQKNENETKKEGEFKKQDINESFTDNGNPQSLCSLKPLGKSQKENLMKSIENKYNINSELIEIGKVLSSGAFGVVKRGTMKVQDEIIPVAIKEIVHSEQVNQEDTMKEVEIMVKMQHENILSCFGCYFKENSCFIVMELADTDLFELKKSENLSKKKKLDLLKQIAEGMNFLHENEIIHRDLKPQNVLIAGEVAKISDFGTSKRVSSIQQTFCGTCEYLAPEVYDSSLKGNLKCIDIFSFSILIWELWTGDVPYKKLKSEKTNQFEMLNVICKGNLRPNLKHEKLADMPEELMILMSSCWEMNPNDRPQSFKEVIKELMQIDCE